MHGRGRPRSRGRFGLREEIGVSYWVLYHSILVLAGIIIAIREYIEIEVRPQQWWPSTTNFRTRNHTDAVDTRTPAPRSPKIDFHWQVLLIGFSLKNFPSSQADDSPGKAFFSPLISFLFPWIHRIRDAMATNNVQVDAASVFGAYVQLPMFDKAEPDAWFILAEANFNLRNSTQ